ncbi:MAG: hypothetical protein K2Z81_18005, partial [Cyanobacteria bacterium]|nr:hypothetical protein [Cyanobacteriota bacterium]
KVRAFDGSVVNCYPGSDVHIYAGSRCQIDKGTMVNFEYVGSWQNRRFPEGANVMANQRNYYVPFGQIIGNVYGPFYVKP